MIFHIRSHIIPRPVLGFGSRLDLIWGSRNDMGPNMENPVQSSISITMLTLTSWRALFEI